MPLFSPSRCVLLISDDGANVYDVGGSKTTLLETVPWDTENFEDAVVQIVTRRCRGKSLLVLNDMVEQHYRKERIPRVNGFDRANLIKRRLAAAFPSYPIRAGLKLKEKGGLGTQGDKGLEGDIYLFTAVPVSEHTSKALNVIRQAHVPIAGFSLLPVESSSMVHAMSKKLSKSLGSHSVWTVFVGQHRSGGLRQIVTKNGELALTRITPIIDNDSDPEAWASDVVGELKGTMSYLSRFGYDPTDGLDVVIVANHSSKDAVTERVDFECNLTLMTTSEAAQILDLKIGRQDEQRYADVLHVAWAGKKVSLTLPLQAAVLEKITAPAKRANIVSIALLGICAYMGYVTFQQSSEWSSLSNQVSDAKKTLDDTTIEHAAEVERKKQAGVDFILIENSTKLYEKFEANAMKPLGVLDIVGRSLDPDLHISSLVIKPLPASQNEPQEDYNESEPPVEGETGIVSETIKKIPSREFEIVIKIIFPGEISPEEGIADTNAYEQRLKKNLPNHEISVIKQVADLSYTGNFVGEATQEQDATKPVEDFEAQIMIRGALHD